MVQCITKVLYVCDVFVILVDIQFSKKRQEINDDALYNMDLRVCVMKVFTRLLDHPIKMKWITNGLVPSDLCKLGMQAQRSS